MGRIAAALLAGLMTLLPISHSASACPKAAAKKIVEGFRKPGELGQFEVVAIRQCRRGRFAKQRGFFVLATFGQPAGTKSEVGWTIYRFLMSTSGKLLARAPTDGASWLTGVAVGKVRFIDLDNDGNDEIIEVIDTYVVDPTTTTTVLRLWRKQAAKLTLLVALPIVHTVGQMRDTGEMEITPGTKPNCVARYKIIRRPRRRRSIVVTYIKTAQPVDAWGKTAKLSKQLAKRVAEVTARLSGSNSSPLGCIRRGTVRLGISGGKLTVR